MTDYADDWPSIPRLDPGLFDRPLSDAEFERLAALPAISPVQLRQRVIGVGLHIARNPQDYDPPPSAKLAVAVLFIPPSGAEMMGSWEIGTLGVKDWKEAPQSGRPMLTWLAQTPSLASLNRTLQEMIAHWPRLGREARQNALVDWAIYDERSRKGYVDFPVSHPSIVKVCAVQIGPAKRTRLQ